MNRRSFLKSIPALAIGLAALPEIIANLRGELAQMFVPENSGPVEFVDLYLQKLGSPTGRFWVVLTDRYYMPLKSWINPEVPAVSDKLDAQLLSNSGQWVRVIFRNPARIQRGVQYHVVLRHD